MKKLMARFIIISLITSPFPLMAQEGPMEAFQLEPNPLTLERLARPGTPFHKTGRNFAILADESGSFEAWAYPLKILREFTFSFFVESSTRPIQGKDIVQNISVTPEATTLTYAYQSFTAKAVYITPVNEPGAVILLQVDSTRPLTVVCGFLPVLQPMWPAGLGGQYSYWDHKLKAYIISEPTGRNHGIIGSPAARGLSYTPAHMLSDTPNEFKIEIPDPNTAKDKYIPIVMAGGKGPREDVLNVYERIITNPELFYRKNVIHFKTLRENTLSVRTPNPKLDLAYEWAKVAYDNLVVENPDLGKGLVAGLGASGTSGRPGFGWFFGGDAFINTFSLLSCGAHQTARDALAFTQKWQRKDGKMAHELSQAAAYIDWWNDYHYGYIHGDTTPYYIAAVYDYAKKTGDVAFIKKSWDSLKTAYEWCLSTDENRDGLMDNQKAGLGALEYGALTGIETDIYLASVWVRAAYAMNQLSEIMGDKAYAAEAAEQFKKASSAFDQKFWDEKNAFYAYAFNQDGQKVKNISPWNAIGLMWNLGSEERSLKSLEKLCSAEIATDWGIRSISNQSPYFQPLNYNYGAVWPFLTSWVTAALYKHHLPIQGYSLLISTANHTFTHGLGNITEVFSGTHFVWPQEAVSHQGFSTAGVVLPFIRGLLGLEADAVNRTLSFAPHFPADWKFVSIKNYEVGNARFSFAYKRDKNSIAAEINSKDAQGYTIRFAPALGIGSKVLSVTVDGIPAEFKTFEKAQVFLVNIEIPVKQGPMHVEIDFVPTVEILPVVPKTKVGDSNKGLKIISLKKEESKMTIKVEGLAGKTYELSLLEPGQIVRVKGAELEKGIEPQRGRLILTMPEAKPGEFVPHTIIIHLID
jgi:glycogen debranching enzyme